MLSCKLTWPIQSVPSINRQRWASLRRWCYSCSLKSRNSRRLQILKTLPASKTSRQRNLLRYSKWMHLRPKIWTKPKTPWILVSWQISLKPKNLNPPLRLKIKKTLVEQFSNAWSLSCHTERLKKLRRSKLNLNRSTWKGLASRVQDTWILRNSQKKNRLIDH